MKTSITLSLLFGCVAARAEKENASDIFLDFRPTPQPFTVVDAERLASEQFRQRFGSCGMVVFKERKFEAWIFETLISYAGTKGPDTVVFSSSPSSVDQMVQTTAKIDSRASIVPKQP